MGIFDFRNPKKKKKKKIIFECQPDKILINETPIKFPTSYDTLKEIFGEASRIDPLKQTTNDVYLWDELGIYCSTPDPDNVLMLMIIKDNSHDLGNQPKRNFTGSVLLDQNEIENFLPKIDQDRPYILRSIDKDDKLVALAIGWNPNYY